MTDRDDGLEFEVVEYRNEVGGVGGHAERTGDGVAGTSTPVIGSDQRDPAAQGLGNELPGRVVPRDAVRGDNGRRTRLTAPSTDEEFAAVDGKREGIVRV